MEDVLQPLTLYFWTILGQTILVLMNSGEISTLGRDFWPWISVEETSEAWLATGNFNMAEYFDLGGKGQRFSHYEGVQINSVCPETKCRSRFSCANICDVEF